MIPEEDTQQSKRAEVAHHHLELHVLLADGGELWLPFGETRFSLGSAAEGLNWLVELDGERVRCRSADRATRGVWRGMKVFEAELRVGECLELGAHKVWLMDARLPEVARLETCPGCERQQHWSLKPQAYRIGRRGQLRVNPIELNHPTVSRAQATLLPLEKGGFGLHCESTSSPTCVNGQPLEPGQTRRLQHGDLLQLGEVRLRFRQGGPEPQTARLLQVQSLGGFCLSWSGLHVPEAAWRAGKARILMARLALAWDRPISTEALLEMLWPGLPTLRGRKNLSQLIGELKAQLGLDGEDELLLRTPACLQLKPEVLGDHDAIELKRLAAAPEAESWSKAVSLYQGPYLANFYEDWALEQRRELQGCFVEACCKLARHHQAEGRFEEAIGVGHKGLAWDPCHQPLALAVMSSAAQLGRPEEALRCFETLCRHLNETFEIEPNAELKALAERL